MKDGLDDEMVGDIWEHNVLPYIEERLYGERDRLREFDLDELRSRDAGENDEGGRDDGDGADAEDETS